MQQEQTFDVIVLGAGMAGASIAAELAASARVLLVEMEDQPGRHTTGRSAAMFFESYGNPVVRALTRASRGFLQQPPGDIADAPLMQRRDAFIVADEDSVAAVDAMLADAADAGCLRRVPVAEVLARCPILRPDRFAAALLDDTGHDIEVAGLHQGWLRRLRQRGGRIVLDAGPSLLQRTGDGWSVQCRHGRWLAPRVVNATGAWADEVAAQAGVPPIGLQPKRRTAVMLPAPEGHDIRAWPLVSDVHETCYFKPDAGQLLLSPANEDDSPPCDAAPEELDVALAAHRFEEMTTVPVRRIVHRWAGLRTFAPDRSPVVGFDPAAEGLFWFAGQGGYGIQMAPAMARVGAALALGQPLPPDIAAQGVEAAALSPARLRTPA
jgi:D-arginine dehydrogenase